MALSFSSSTMFSFLVVLTMFLSTQALPDGNKIVNGTNAEPGEIPYIVSLQCRLDNSLYMHCCGGSILNKQWILTAAHCVYDWDPSQLSIVYGVTNISSDGLNRIPVEKRIAHSSYEPWSGYRYDVAVLRLAQPLAFNEFVQPVPLPPALNATPEGAPAVLAGWGRLCTGCNISDVLQRVDIQVYTDDDCESLHSETGPTNRQYHVCAGVVGGGKGQCNGDSGGPLVVNGTQVGIVSWSIKPCAVAPYPGVFTKVSSFIEWISEKMGIAEEEAGHFH